jgi:hypothetical protein
MLSHLPSVQRSVRDVIHWLAHRSTRVYFIVSPGPLLPN